MTWFGWVAVSLYGATALLTISNDNTPAGVRVLSVAISAAMLVGALLVGTGHV